MSNGGWTGVDLDGTLAMYDKWRGPAHIGPPIPLMLERVRGWLAEGKEVRIFTARVSSDGTLDGNISARMAKEAIRDWCYKYFRKVLEVTNEKDHQMVELWDDRAVQVGRNTGVRVDGKEA